MTGWARQGEAARRLWDLCCGRFRARCLAMRGAQVGSKAAIGMRCIIDRPWCVELGERSQIEHDVYLKVVADTASLKLGDCVFIGRGVEFDVTDNVSVGQHTVIAPRCFITDHNHGMQAGRRIDQQPCVAAAISIGADVWLGTGVVVLPGVNIGDGAVVGANSVVTSDVDAMTVVAGTPARFLRMRAGAAL